MGIAKTIFMQVDEILTPIAIQAGALKTCSYHEHCLIDCDDHEAQRMAYAMATNAWKDGILLGPREDVMEELHDLIATTPFECSHCADMMVKD